MAVVYRVLKYRKESLSPLAINPSESNRNGVHGVAFVSLRFATVSVSVSVSMSVSVTFQLWATDFGFVGLRTWAWLQGLGPWALLKCFIMKSCDNLSCGFDLAVCFFKWLIVCQYALRLR